MTRYSTSLGALALLSILLVGCSHHQQNAAPASSQASIQTHEQQRAADMAAQYQHRPPGPAH